jgi:hypothetical protein
MAMRQHEGSRLALVALCVAVAMGGCGGQGDKGAYKQRLQRIDTTLRSQMATAGQHLGPGGPKRELAAGYTASAAALNKAAGDLGALRPPREVTTANMNLIRGLRSLASGFAQAAAEARSGQLDKARAFLDAAPKSPAAAQIRSATAALTARGYDPAAPAVKP